jgi:hypothetical protein
VPEYIVEARVEVLLEARFTATSPDEAEQIARRQLEDPPFGDHWSNIWSNVTDETVEIQQIVEPPVAIS